MEAYKLVNSPRPGVWGSFNGYSTPAEFEDLKGFGLTVEYAVGRESVPYGPLACLGFGLAAFEDLRSVHGFLANDIYSTGGEMGLMRCEVRAMGNPSPVLLCGGSNSRKAGLAIMMAGGNVIDTMTWSTGWPRGTVLCDSIAPLELVRVGGLWDLISWLRRELGPA